MIIRANVFIVPILHPESSGNRSKLNKTQPFAYRSGHCGALLIICIVLSQSWLRFPENAAAEMTGSE